MALDNEPLYDQLKATKLGVEYGDAIDYFMDEVCYDPDAVVHAFVAALAHRDKQYAELVKAVEDRGDEAFQEWSQNQGETNDND